jgi:hypothetical protein
VAQIKTIIHESRSVAINDLATDLGTYLDNATAMKQNPNV